MGSATLKRRPCCSDGTARRALSTLAGSILAMKMPGSTPPSARTVPQGSTINEWPYVSRLFSCMPPCAAANTKQPVSMARARSSVCQCASPVFRVKAEGTVSNEAPLERAEQMQRDGFREPLDLADAAARVLDPVFVGVETGEPAYGRLFKDYRVVAW